MRLLAVAATLCLAAPALAEERLDHRGALGLSLGAGVEHASTQLFSAANPADVKLADATRLVLELDPTFAVGTEGNELVATLRFLKGPDAGGAVGFGYRGYFGRDEWKTYFQGQLVADSVPSFALGVSAAFGAMYELSPLAGLYAQAGASFEVGANLRVGFELTGGLQLRTYVLE